MVIPSWYQRPGYVRAMADLICEELDKFEDRGGTEIFFSAHGVPQSYVDDGEPQPKQGPGSLQPPRRRVPGGAGPG